MASLNFWTDGECFTNIIRDMWVSCLPYNALSSLLEGDQMPKEMALDICQGRKKFEGDTRKGDHTLSVVDDNATEYNDCKLFSVEEMIAKLEEDFLIRELFLRGRRKELEYRKELEISIRNLDLPNYEHDIEAARKDVKKTMKHLEYIYPYAGKTMVDLPIDKLLQMWSEYEVERMNEMKIPKARVEGIAKANLSSNFNLDPNTFDEYQQTAKDRVDKILQSPLMNGIDLESLDVETYVKKAMADDRDNIKLQSIKDSVFNAGYIDPKGKFYGCSDASHLTFADDLAKAGLVPGFKKPEYEDEDEEIENMEDTQIWLEENGWMKLSFGRLFFEVNKKFKKPTKKQVDTVAEYCLKRKEKGHDSVHYNEKNYDFKKIFEELAK